MSILEANINPKTDDLAFKLDVGPTYIILDTQHPKFYLNSYSSKSKCMSAEGYLARPRLGKNISRLIDNSHCRCENC